MQALFKRLWRDAGQDTTEYVLAVLLVALAVTAGMLLLATEINEAFSEAGSVLDTAPGPSSFRNQPWLVSYGHAHGLSDDGAGQRAVLSRRFWTPS